MLSVAIWFKPWFKASPLFALMFPVKAVSAVRPDVPCVAPMFKIMAAVQCESCQRRNVELAIAYTDWFRARYCTFCGRPLHHRPRALPEPVARSRAPSRDRGRNRIERSRSPEEPTRADRALGPGVQNARRGCPPRYKLVDYLPAEAVRHFGPHSIGHREVEWHEAMAEIQTCWTQNLSLIVLNETFRDMGREECNNLKDALATATQLRIINGSQERWLKLCNKLGNQSKHEPGWADPARRFRP